MKKLIVLLAICLICCCSASDPYGRWRPEWQVPPRPDSADLAKDYRWTITIKADSTLKSFYIETNLWGRGKVYSNNPGTPLYEKIQFNDLAFVLKHVALTYPHADYSVVFPEEVRDDEGKAGVTAIVWGAGIEKCVTWS